MLFSSYHWIPASARLQNLKKYEFLIFDDDSAFRFTVSYFFLSFFDVVLPLNRSVLFDVIRDDSLSVFLVIEHVLSSRLDDFNFFDFFFVVYTILINTSIFIKIFLQTFLVTYTSSFSLCRSSLISSRSSILSDGNDKMTRSEYDDVLSIQSLSESRTCYIG